MWSDFGFNNQFEVSDNIELVPIKLGLHNPDPANKLFESIELPSIQIAVPSSNSTKAITENEKPRIDLKESVDDEAKVKMCLNRKDVVIKR